MVRNDPKWIILHHSGGLASDPLFDTSNQTFKDIDDYHKFRWNGTTNSSLGYYSGYHYVIDKLGIITQARNDLEGGAHTIGMNYQSIGICLIGNFDAKYPTEQQKKTLSVLLSILQGRYLIPWSRIVPHRTFANKTCFGKNLTNTWGAELLQNKVFTNGYIRSMIQKLINLKIINEPKLALLFGALSSGPLNNLEAD